MPLKPTQIAPPLSLPLSGGGSTTELELGSGVDGRFTLVVFYRGLHCPVCRKQLAEIQRRLDDLTAAGIGRVVAVSMETESRSHQVKHDWRLDRLKLAYGLTEAAAREWGLFLSTGSNDNEPPVFNEPGMFVLDRDGSLYWANIASMPFGRPAIDDVVAALKFVAEKNYPARGQH